jgi:drug/metabolite transporter (DMT)-like permease
MWGAVGLGLLGSCLVALGGITAESAESAAAYPDEFRGVCLLLAASLAISVATIRLGTLGEGDGSRRGIPREL